MEKEIFKGKYFRVTTEDVTPDLCYERVYQRNGVTVLPIENGRLRLIKKTTADNPTPRIRPVSGYIEDGESPIECAKRELIEELGLVAEGWFLFTEAYGEGGLKKIQYFFIAKRLLPFEGSRCLDPNENISEEPIDLSYEEVKLRTLSGEFGTASNAFAILKFVLEQ